ERWRAALPVRFEQRDEDLGFFHAAAAHRAGKGCERPVTLPFRNALPDRWSGAVAALRSRAEPDGAVGEQLEAVQPLVWVAGLGGDAGGRDDVAAVAANVESFAE